MTTPIAPRPHLPGPAPAPHPGWGPPAPPLPPPPPPPPDSGGPDRARQPVGLQNLLLGLGTALVAVAVVVFTAVNWSQLDAGVQGLILVALTVVAAAGAGVASKRSMPATAEAVALVAMLLAVADVHAFRVSLAPGADPAFCWAGGLALVAGASWALGRAGRIRSPQVAAAVVGQLPLLFVLAGTGTSIVAAQWAVVAQALVVVFGFERISAPRWARISAIAWALAMAAIFTVATVLDSAFEAAFADGDRLGSGAHLGATGLSLVAAALLAMYVAWWRADSAATRTVALLGATSMGLAAVWFGGLEVFTGDVALGLVAVGAALLILAGRSLPARWGEVPVIVGGVVAAFSSVPLLAAMSSMLVAASTVSAEAWDRSATVRAASLQLPEADVVGSASLVLLLAAAAIVVCAVARRASKLIVGSAVGCTILAAVVVGPLLVPLSIAGTVLVALTAVVAATALAVALGARSSGSGHGFEVAAGFGVTAYAWATPWSLATPGLTFATLGAGIVTALVIGWAARRRGSVAIGAAACIWACAATPLLAGLVVWDGGSTVAMSWALAAATASVVSIIGVMLLDPSGRADGTDLALAGGVETTSLVAYLGSLAVTATLADPQALSVALAAGVVGFGLHAVRPRRRLAVVPAALEALVFTWLQLDRADVQLVEAYTLPLALLLLLVGVVAERTRPSTEAPASWVTFGPALVVAVAPTVWLSLTQAGSGRPLAGLVAGAVVLVGGVVWGKRALVDVGTATVVVLGLRQIAPVVGSMPNWATIGATGVLLLAVGATFEQRRRDLKAAVRKYSALT